MDFVLQEGRAQITLRAQKLMQEILDRYKTGISVSKVTMQNAQPPEQVQAAFDDARLSLSRVLDNFRYGNGVLDRLLGGGRIDRVVFVATKSDHIARSQFLNLSALLREMTTGAPDVPTCLARYSTRNSRLSIGS